MKILYFTRKTFFKLPLTLLFGLILLVCAFVYADRNAGVHRTFQTATTHNPENFTELYFSDYKSLHHTLIVGKSYTVPFTINNHESKAFTYTYQTELTRGSSKVVSKPVTVTVGDGKSVQKTASFNVNRPGQQVELVIRVLNKNLTIHYKAQS